MTLLPPGVKVHLALGYIDCAKGSTANLHPRKRFHDRLSGFDD
jgi:hypothetical protein